MALQSICNDWMENWLYWRSRIHRKACTKIQGQVTSGANSIAQRATITAVDLIQRFTHG
jgi:hypothetical protein